MARTKPRLFAFSREVELAHLSLDTSTPPAKAALLKDVVETFAHIARNKAVSEELLDPFEEAACYDDAQVRGLGMLRLSVLTHYFPEAGERFAALVTHANVEIRRFAVTVLANTEQSLVASLLPVALADEDWMVRKAAATVAGALPLPQLQPVFERQLFRERDARVRVVLQLAVDHQAALSA